MICSIYEIFYRNSIGGILKLMNAFTFQPSEDIAGFKKSELKF